MWLNTKSLRPFIGIAKKKGLLLSFDECLPKDYYALWRVDMDLVRASIENAITQSKRQKMDAITVRLERLIFNGTDAQQLDFVLGGGSVYYFPEDVEKMIHSGPKVAHRFNLQRLSWLRCRPLNDGTQICEEHNKQLCMLY
jgi:hypothetical protein